MDLFFWHVEYVSGDPSLVHGIEASNGLQSILIGCFNFLFHIDYLSQRGVDYSRAMRLSTALGQTGAVR